MGARVTTVTVGTTSKLLTQVPAGHTVLIQNRGSAACFVSVNQDALATQGIMLAGGTPGGSVATTPPGTPTPQNWYACTASGTTTVAVLVI